MALLYPCRCHCDSCRSGTLGLANASRHTGQIDDQQWAKWQLSFKLMSLFQRTEKLFLSLLAAARCHCKDNCPAGHFTHGGSLPPSDCGIVIELSDTERRIVDLSVFIMPHQHTWILIGKRGEKSPRKQFLIFIRSEAFLSRVAYVHIQKNTLS